MSLTGRINWRAVFEDVGKWERIIALRKMPCVDFTALRDTFKEYKELQKEVMQLGRAKNSLLAQTETNNQGRLLRAEKSQKLERIRKLELILDHAASSIPNDIHSDTPETDKTIMEFHTDKLASSKCDHISKLREMGWMDGEEGVRVAGNGFAVMRGKGALLEHALVNYALKFAISRSFVPLTVPDLVYADTVENSGFAPRNDQDAVYRVDGEGLVLAGTAELPLLALNKNCRLDQLPQLMVAMGRAFRREKGHSGSASRGLYRLHQFTKVELFALSTSEQSDQVYDMLCKVQLDLIKSLGFPGRVLQMSACELGASAFRKRDIELYFPSLARYGEVTSASHCADYQSRRMDIRSSKGEFVHTMNATALAVPRILQCIVEHGGGVPDVLEEHVKYLSF